MFIKLKQSNRGDTIVEVLLALTVLSMIIGSGYAIATKSLNGVLIAQERSQATKLAEGQLEAMQWNLAKHSTLKDLADNKLLGYDSTWTSDLLALAPAPGGSPYPEGFCIDGSGDPIPVYDISALGTFCSFADAEFQFFITTSIKRLNYDPSPMPANDVKELTYTVHVVWLRAAGGNNEQLTLSNRFLVK